MAKNEKIEKDLKEGTKAKAVLPKTKGETKVENKSKVAPKKAAPKRRVASVQGDAEKTEKVKTTKASNVKKEAAAKTKTTTKAVEKVETDKVKKVVKATGAAKTTNVSKADKEKTPKKEKVEATKKVEVKKEEKVEAKKAVVEPKKEVVNKKETAKKESTKKTNEQSVIEKIKSFISKIIAMQEEEKSKDEEIKETKTTAKKSTEKKVEAEKVVANKAPNYMLEYYDLPYRYNETVVKILAQTPKRLFVYWDISDKDRQKYINSFGEDFFEKTYPVLLVYNEDKKYTREIPINDFANSWYIDIDDPKTSYKIQLGRKFISKPEIVNVAEFQKENIILRTDYLPFADSNDLEVPNDHVLLECLPKFVTFRNVKTNEEYTKDMRSFVNVFGENYDVKQFYNDNYKEEVSEGIFDMANPSSNLTSSSFK